MRRNMEARQKATNKNCKCMSPTILYCINTYYAYILYLSKYIVHKLLMQNLGKKESDGKITVFVNSFFRNTTNKFNSIIFCLY